jgi:hypothetical protein
MEITPHSINVLTDAKFYDTFRDTVSVRFNGNVGITAYAADDYTTLSFTSLSLTQFREIVAQVEHAVAASRCFEEWSL